MRTVIVCLLAASTLVGTTEASFSKNFGRKLRQHGAQKYGHNFQTMSEKAAKEKKQHQHDKELAKIKHMKEEAEKNSERPEEKGNGEYTHPQKAHLLHSKEQEKYDAPVKEFALTPEEYEKQHKEEMASKHLAEADKVVEAPVIAAKHVVEEHKKEEHADKKARKLMVPIKWSKQEQEFISTMMFSFSGVFLTFVAVLIGCLLCRKNIKKPLIDQESQLWSSFVEEKKEDPEAIYQLEQKGKAPLTKKQNFGSMKNKDRDIELA